MHTTKIIPWLVVIVALLVAALFLFKQNPEQSQVIGAIGSSSSPALLAHTKKIPTIFPSDSGGKAGELDSPAAIALEVAVAPGDPAAQNHTDQLAFLLRDFRNSLSQYPIGTNAEITAALLGNNLKQVRFDVPEGSSLSPSKELCDTWGTPYFFHHLSSSQMEVRSAGADRKMWSGDDLIAR